MRRALSVVSLTLFTCTPIGQRALSVAALAPTCADEIVRPDPQIEIDRGRALFLHRWTPNDPAAAADGLGPKFNDTSCGACHAQGGPGGSGGNHKNAGDNVVRSVDKVSGNFELDSMLRRGLMGMSTRAFPVQRSHERNTPALFGAGLVDSIPESAIQAAAATSYPEWPKVKGVVGTAPDGRVGRFGWKADASSLTDFVQRACEEEIGLTVEPACDDVMRTPTVDLAPQDVDALTAYIGDLPAPGVSHVEGADRGEVLFEQVGCAACHAPSMADVRGIYSDLLMHDMGETLGDATGAYGRPVTESVAIRWRTPPLWGVRDSSPYLHDGRADAIADAIDLHAGEAADSRRAFVRLPVADREAVLLFLDTLVAPGMVASL